MTAARGRVLFAVSMVTLVIVVLSASVAAGGATTATATDETTTSGAVTVPSAAVSPTVDAVSPTSVAVAATVDAATPTVDAAAMPNVADGSTAASTVATPLVQDEPDEPGNDSGDVDDAAEDGADGSATEPTRHRNPSEYSGDADTDRLEGWLSDRLTERLEGSAAELEEGEYDLAREHVDEEYRNYLNQYVDVADDGRGDGEAESFETAREEQARLADRVETYEETRAEYEAARERGDDARARELAHELERLSSEVEESEATLDDAYDEIEEDTDANVSEGREAVERMAGSVEDAQEAVRAEQFRGTELRLDPDRTTISYREPLTGTGRLVTANGSAVARETVTLEIGNRTQRVETGADGTFRFGYRPTNESLGAAELPVEYVPDNRSPYLGTETTVDVSIEQNDPTVTALETPSSVSYGDEVPVRGELAVGDVPVDGVPLVVTLGGERIGNVSVSNGTFEGTATVPASVPDGERELGVALAFRDRALGPTSATRPVTVEETGTELSTDAVRVSDAIHVTGTFETDAGEAIPNESIRLTVGDATIDAGETGAEGGFNETVAIPPGAAGETTVVASYDGSGSNFAGAEAETTVDLSGAGSGTNWVDAVVPGAVRNWFDGAILGPVTGWIDAAVPWWAPYLLGAGLAGGIALAIRRYRRSSPPSAPTGGGDGAGLGSTDAPAGPSVSRALLARARDQLAGGRPDEAVRTSYAAVRRSLGAGIDDRALTHWEFYSLYRDRSGESLDPAEDDRLHDVIEGFERARFDGRTVPTDDAERILDRASSLCGLEREPVREPTADD